MILSLAASLLALAATAPARAEAFTPGEEAVYQVTYLRLPTGEARISVGAPQGSIWPVTFQAKTGGIASLFDIKEHMVSFWDHTTRSSRGSDLRAYEVGDLHVDSTRFDRENGKATVTIERKGRKKVKNLDVPSDVHELTSAFMWLRLQPLAEGQTYRVPVIASNKASTLVMQVEGREQVKTPAGRFEAFKLKVETQIEGKFSSSRPLAMWVTTDDAHVLLRVEADFAVGSMVVALKRYTPGAPLTADAR
ncbi:MAG: DUF3108 domain-containing protein [Anaeromyxobacter sp.]